MANDRPWNNAYNRGHNPCWGCNRPNKRPPTKDDNGCHSDCPDYAIFVEENAAKNQHRRELWVPMAGPGQDNRAKG